MQLKFHTICSHQVYYLHYALEITKCMSETIHQLIYQIIKQNSRETSIEFSFVKHYQRYFIKLSSCFLLKPFTNSLTWCQQPPLNSFFLFNNQLALKYSIRCTFSAKHNGQKLFLSSFFVIFDSRHQLLLLRPHVI